MNLIIDATPLDLYPFSKPGFTGATEIYAHKLAEGLATRGHTVHVVTPDLTTLEHRAPTLFYWPKAWHPTEADAVVMFHNLEHIGPYSADLLILVSNGLGADLGPQDEFASGLDAVACLTKKHVDLLTLAHPKIDRSKCFVTGLGVDLSEYRGDILPARRPGRLLWTSSPERGLWHAVDIFEHVQKDMPEATLHLTYDWERFFHRAKWDSNHQAAQMWQIKERIDANPAIVNRGGLSREELIQAQLEAQIFLFPCDPQLIGSQLHSLAALEAAAAGCALVLSQSEALPEVFGSAAEILPIPGHFDPHIERRWDAQDWAAVCLALLQSPEKWAQASRSARSLAERSTWGAVLDVWDAKLDELQRRDTKSA